MKRLCHIFFPFNGHLPLSIRAPSHLALATPSQSRGDRRKEGACLSLTLLPMTGRNFLQRKDPCHDWPCTALHFSCGVSQGLTKHCVEHNDRCCIPTSSHLLPFCLRSADVHDAHLFQKWDPWARRGEGVLQKGGAFDPLYSPALWTAYISTSPSLQKFIETLQQKMQRIFLCCPPSCSKKKQVLLSCVNSELLLEMLQAGALAGAGIWKQRLNPGAGLCWGGFARQLLPTSMVSTCLLTTLAFVVQVFRLVTLTAN